MDPMGVIESFPRWAVGCPWKFSLQDNNREGRGSPNLSKSVLQSCDPLLTTEEKGVSDCGLSLLTAARDETKNFEGAYPSSHNHGSGKSA